VSFRAYAHTEAIAAYTRGLELDEQSELDTASQDDRFWIPLLLIQAGGIPNPNPSYPLDGLGSINLTTLKHVK
jgi:hypothetical protein